jgi:hypothetical protein
MAGNTRLWGIFARYASREEKGIQKESKRSGAGHEILIKIIVFSPSFLPCQSFLFFPFRHIFPYFSRSFACQAPKFPLS